MRLPLARTVVLLLMVVSLAVGCREAKPVPPTKLSDEIPGLKLTATVDGPAFVKKTDKMATIFAGFNTISVNHTQVAYNKLQIAELPKGTTEVDLTFKPGEITIMANGQLVATVPVK
jgi:hypothetical protein